MGRIFADVAAVVVDVGAVVLIEMRQRAACHQNNVGEGLVLHLHCYLLLMTTMMMKVTNP